jgi:hypothetical protein
MEVGGAKCRIQTVRALGRSVVIVDAQERWRFPNSRNANDDWNALERVPRIVCP